MQRAPLTGALDPVDRPGSAARRARGSVPGAVLWEFTDVLGRRLVAWAAPSVGIGALLLLVGDAFGRGLGLQLMIWGTVEAAIGLVARYLGARGRRRTVGDKLAHGRESQRLRRLLWLNAWLDAGYVAIGLWLVAGGAGEPFRLGSGWGIMVQGGFLLAFEMLHATWVPGPEALIPEGLPMFTEPEHQPLRIVPWTSPPTGRSAAGGALLVHGFGGTPAELRAMGETFGRLGWAVDVPLLPGHGPLVRDLADYRVEDWIAEVEAGAASLRAAGANRLLVVGHSVGAALALATAPSVRPDALVLLAPFWWDQPAWQRMLGPAARAFLPPGFKIFRRVDLTAPEVRRGLQSFLPGMDLDDPSVVRMLREMTVPISVFEQLYRMSRLAVEAVPGIDVPVLGVQGLEDRLVLPGRTRALLARFPSRPEPVEVQADHDLLTEASPARQVVLETVLAFAERTVSLS